MTLDKALDLLSENLITPKFLQMVEKWARYDGKPFSIGDDDLTVKNLGIWKTERTDPKITIIDEKFLVSKTETETTTTYYDVTQIINNPVCTEYNNRILIAEKKEASLFFQPKLWIYAIHQGGRNTIGNDNLPLLKMLKKDFECEAYTTYQSLLYEHLDEYRLISYSEYTDRIRNFSTIAFDLECLESDEDAIELSKHLKKIPLRPTKKERRKQMDEMLKKFNESKIK